MVLFCRKTVTEKLRWGSSDEGLRVKSVFQPGCVGFSGSVAPPRWHCHKKSDGVGATVIFKDGACLMEPGCYKCVI